MAKDGRTFVVAAGGWSGNIGNSFFNLGTQHVLSKAVPDARVELISDQAAYWRMTPIGYRTEPRNSLRYMDHLRPDCIVLQGSVLTEHFPRVWGRSLRILHEAGTRLLLVGVGFFDYSEGELGACRALLEECPPHVFVSRDRRTYAALRDLAPHSHDGIDSAFFLPDVFRPIGTDLPPYVVVNFDKGPEPAISVSRNGGGAPSDVRGRCIRFEFGGSQWTVAFPPARQRLSRMLGTAYPYLLGPLGLAATSQKRAGEYLVVRTDHQINPMIVRKVFRGPNALAGDIPQSYINLYAQASLTLSDRVHAVVAALAYGQSAMLFSRSGRAAILDRVRASGVTTRPIRLDLDLLEREKEAELSFLRSVLS